MDIGQAAEVLARHIERLGRIDPNAQEELTAAVKAFHAAASKLSELDNRTKGQVRFGGFNVR